MLGGMECHINRWFFVCHKTEETLYHNQAHRRFLLLFYFTFLMDLLIPVVVQDEILAQMDY